MDGIQLRDKRTEDGSAAAPADDRGSRSRQQQSTSQTQPQPQDVTPSTGQASGSNDVEEDERSRDDVYTAAAYGDLPKLQRLVLEEGHDVNVPDAGGYYALQWAALNNKPAVAQFLIEVGCREGKTRG